jgi:CheY-like chemotaxis protein
MVEDVMKLLLVEDNEFLRRALLRLLPDHVEPLVATSVREAQEILQGIEVDGVLSDVMLEPGHPGTTLHAWLKVHRPSLAQTMTFMTGGVSDPHAAEYLSHLSNRILHKPFDPSALLGLFKPGPQ